MGGSGIAGDVLAAVGERELPVPVTVLKQYPHAGVRRARHARVRAVVLGRHRGDAVDGRGRGRGGRDARRGRRAAVSSATLRRARRAARPVPAGLHAARRARRAGRAAVRDAVPLGLLPEAHALLVDGAGAAGAAARPRAGPRSTGAANPARELARRIGRTIPLVYGGGALGAVAAMRWKCDVNENAKAPAFWNALSRARPQRDLRVGPARRRHPPGVHARRAAPRLRARAARRRASTSTRELIEECVRAGARGAGRRGGPARAAARPHVRRRLGRAATSRSTTTSTPARSTPSPS